MLAIKTQMLYNFYANVPGIKLVSSNYNRIVCHIFVLPEMQVCSFAESLILMSLRRLLSVVDNFSRIMDYGLEWWRILIRKQNTFGVLFLVGGSALLGQWPWSRGPTTEDSILVSKDLQWTLVN